MSRITHVRMLPFLILAASVGAPSVAAPSVAAAGPHGGGHHGGTYRGGGHHGRAGASHRPVTHGGATSWRAARPPIRDHRAARPSTGPRPYPQPVLGAYGRYFGHWPYGYAWYPGPYGSSYQAYSYGAPAVTEPVTPQSPEPRSRGGLAAHLGQLQRDDGVTADLAGLSLRWRGRTFEGELELGRRVYAGDERTERTLAGTLYANLGDVDVLHPYLLVGAGLLGNDRVFGAVGAGLALPLASRLTLTGDLRSGWIGARDHHDRGAAREVEARTLEGRLSLVVDL